MSVSFSIAMPQKRRPYSGPVLPVIDAKRSGRGVVLTFGGDSVRSVAAEAFTAVVVAVAAFFTIRQWAHEGCMMWFVLLMIIPTVFGGYASFIRSSFRARFFGSAQLTIDHWPLRLGDTVKVRFVRAVKASLDMTTEAAVEYIEEVMIGDEDRSVLTQRRFHQPLDPEAVRLTGRQAIAEWTFVIPVDRPPSFAVTDNAIIWRVSVNFTWRNSATAPATFPLLVLPEVTA